MAYVAQFNRAMVETFLKSQNWRYLIDNDGDYQVQFGYEQDRNCPMTIYLMFSGSQKLIFYLRVTNGLQVPRNDWPRAMMICNTWNKERRWPKAYLFVNDQSKDSSGIIVLEEQIDLEKGIHQELFDDWTITAISGANFFWEWAHKEQRFL